MSTASNSPQLMGPQVIMAGPGIELGAPAGAPAAHEAEGLNLGDLTRMLKLRKVTIIVTTIICYGLVTVGFLIANRYFPRYVSQALFEMSPPRGGGYGQEERNVTPETMENLLRTEANKLKSLELLISVVDQPIVKKTSYFAQFEDDLRLAAEELKEDLSVAPVTNTYLISVAFGWHDKIEARDIVQVIVDRFQNQFRDKSDLDLKQEMDSLSETRSNILKDVDAKREQIKKFRETLRQPGMESERDASRELIAELRKTNADADSQIAALEAQLNSITSYGPDRAPLTAEQQLLIESDPILRFYVNQVQSLDVEIAANLLRIGEEHRDMKMIKRRRQEFYDREIARREELTQQIRQRQVENLRDELARSRAAAGRILEALQSAEASQRDLDASMLQFQQFEDEKRMMENLLASVEESLTQAKHAYSNRAIVPLRVVQRPQLATEPAFPDPIIFFAGGAVLALVAGVGIAFLRELTDKVVRTPVDLLRAGRLPVLGNVPLLDYEEANIESIEHAVERAPGSLVAEAFRQIRVHLQFSPGATQTRSLLVTSPAPGDGKTAVAINLGVTLANSGQRVLLIDCNFRRPGIRAAMAGTKSDGLSNILSGQGRLEDFVTATDVPNLFVLTTGPMPDHPSEMLASQAMRDLVSKAAGEYARVLLDAPPTLVVSDAVILAAVVDGIILVARAERNSKGVLTRAREHLASTGTRIVGTILNGVRARAGGYFRKQYREFYDYRSDESAPFLNPPVKTDGDQTS